MRKIVAEEIEIIVTARVEEALREFKKMLPEIKKQMGQIQSEVNKVDFKDIAKNVNFSKVTKQVKEANKEVQKVKKTMSSAFGTTFKADDINEKIKQYENKVKSLQAEMNKTELKLNFVEENKKDIRERKKPNEDLGNNKEYVKLDQKSQELQRNMRSYNSLLKEARTELIALREEAENINIDTNGINFQNVKKEINGISAKFQKLKGSNFDLGNMVELQKCKKKIEEIKPVVKQVSEEISKIGFVKYDSKSINDFVDNYKKEADGGDISGMKINGVDFDKVNDDLSNVEGLKKYQQNLEQIGTEAEKSKSKVESLSNVKFVDYSKMQAKDLLQPQTTTPSNQLVQIAPSGNSMSMWDILKAKIQQMKPYVEEFQNALRGSGSSKELELLNYKISELEEKLQGGVNGEVHLSTKEVVEAEAELERLNKKKEQLEKSGGGSNVFSGMFLSLQKIMPKLNGVSGITIKIKNQMKQMSTGMKQGLGHILKYAGALFSLRSIYSALSGSASSWLSSQNAGAQQLSTNIEYMKNAMGSALAPVIQWITGLIYNLMKAIQSVVYALFKVNIFAKASAKSYASMAGSAKKAKDETKQLAGVHDEINNIQSNENADSGGGSGGGSGMPSFDLSKVDLSSSIMDAIANGDWYGVGALLGQKLNEAMASIPWRTNSRNGKADWDKYC